MMLLARILAVLLLAAKVAAQDAPEPPVPPPLEATEQADSQESAPETTPAEAPNPTELPEPTWDPVAESAKIEKPEPRERRSRSRRQQNWGDPTRDRTAFGQHVVIRTNESIHNLVLIGGSAEIEGEVERDLVAIGASVKLTGPGKVGGDLVVVGGKGEFAGEVGGDTVVVIGSAEVAPTAKLERDAFFLGGPFNVANEASIGGQRTTVPFGDFLPQIEWFKEYLVRGPLLGRWLTFQLGWPWAIAATFLAVYFGMLLVFPSASRAVYTALEERPVTSIFTGLLTMILFAPLTFLLIISVVGIIVIPFLKISLLLALIFGKVGVLCFLGRGFIRSSGMTRLNMPIAAFALGAIILTGVYTIPFFGMFAWAMATVFGLGGAIVALFGTFKREEGRIPPAPVLVSTIRPGPSAPYQPSSTGVPGPSAPIPGINQATGSAAESFSPQDTVLLRRAGFWSRFLAALIDLIVVVVIVALPVVTIAFFIPIAVAYFAGMWTWKGATIGGMLLGHKVVRTDGRPIELSVAFVRSVSSILSCLVGFLGCMWAGWDREKQTWHDKIAGTVVVKVPRGLAFA